MTCRTLAALALVVACVPARGTAQTATLLRFGTATPPEPIGDPSASFTLRAVNLSVRMQAPATRMERTAASCAGAGTMRRRSIYSAMIRSSEREAGLPIGLMDSLVCAESEYDPTIVSPAGAAGLAQLMPRTAIALGVANRFDPESNVRAGARYLRNLLERFEGDIPLALAAYNAGPGAVLHARGIPLNGETPTYVARILRYWNPSILDRQAAGLSARQLATQLGFLPSSEN